MSAWRYSKNPTAIIEQVRPSSSNTITTSSDYQLPWHSIKSKICRYYVHAAASLNLLEFPDQLGVKVGSQSDTRPYVALIREIHKFIIKKSRGFLDDQTQEHNAGECKDRIRVYPSIVLCFYKRRREDDTTQCIVGRCIVNQPLVITQMPLLQ